MLRLLRTLTRRFLQVQSASTQVKILACRIEFRQTRALPKAGRAFSTHFTDRVEGGGRAQQHSTTQQQHHRAEPVTCRRRGASSLLRGASIRPPSAPSQSHARAAQHLRRETPNWLASPVPTAARDTTSDTAPQTPRLHVHYGFYRALAAPTYAYSG